MKDMKSCFEAYDRFHEQMAGDVKNLNCGHICATCADNCESPEDGEVAWKYILAFLPYEAEYVADHMKMDRKAFFNNHLYGVKTPSGTVNILKVHRQCAFINERFECLMGEHKIITCKLFPVIHYPLIGFNFSRHCALTSDPAIRANYEKGIEHYKELLKTIGVDDFYLYLRESFDVLQMDYRKGKSFYDSPVYTEIGLEEFKACLVGNPEYI